jgi:hypothetical protein
LDAGEYQVNFEDHQRDRFASNMKARGLRSGPDHREGIFNDDKDRTEFVRTLG